ncbi:MAG TPA: hypothetical protein VGZ71_16620 [Puia sp.]|jgi:hypothetical protein|nr:hypothetical protein [Puia sp.]
MKKASRLFLLFLFLFIPGVFPSCKKFVQQQEQNALINILTNGVWVVTNYSENGNNITSAFSGYTFQFKSNGTVMGINGSTVVNGTWAGDLNKRTITSDFPTAGTPIDKLNAVWTITDSYVDSVSANTIINSQTDYLSMKKH